MCLLNNQWQPEIIKGHEDPPHGWISRGFDRKVPTVSLRWAGTITGVTELITEIKIETLEKEHL